LQASVLCLYIDMILPQFASASEASPDVHTCGEDCRWTKNGRVPYSKADACDFIVDHIKFLVSSDPTVVTFFRVKR
jgi:hypothetical protein